MLGLGLLLLLLSLPTLLTTIDLVKYFLNGKRLYRPGLERIIAAIVMVLYPMFYLLVIDEPSNDCCSDSAVFSPDHRLSIYLIIIFSHLAYFYSLLKDDVASPVLEVLMNLLLLIGLIFNIFLAIHIASPILLIGSIPVFNSFLLQLFLNHQRLKESAVPNYDRLPQWEKQAWNILYLQSLQKYPLLFILIAPFWVIFSSILLLLGQQPDSVIRSFTDTYKHGFSQLDHLCNNVECGGHFLCSVAAKGHKSLVRPIRYGERRGHKIICNRQLLIANAFEDLISEKWPNSHAMIRRNYNKVGAGIHRYYSVFNRKPVADLIYLLMKPLEWSFLFVLYLFDKNPENRIAKQYLSVEHRRQLGAIDTLNKIGAVLPLHSNGSVKVEKK
jgi:hypothetical protein